MAVLKTKQPLANIVVYFFALPLFPELGGV